MLSSPFPSSPSTMPRRSLTQTNVAGWGFAAPAALMLFVFIILPFLMAIYFSLTNARMMSPNAVEFVGLDNYQKMLSLNRLVLEPQLENDGTVRFHNDGSIRYEKVRTYTRDEENYPHFFQMREWFGWERKGGEHGTQYVVIIAGDPLFWIALTNTLIFVLVIAPVQGGLALGLALLVNQKLHGINIFRTIYFMPVVVSIIVASILWSIIYAPDGLLNSMLIFFSFGYFEGRDWLGDTQTALPAIMAFSIWQAVGFHMVIWLAGLQTIPPTLYEVGDVEGASNWQKFRFITWPGLRNTAVLVLIVITMQAFALFNQINVMTKGGPLDATQSLVFQSFVRGYGKNDLSGASTIAVVLFVLVLFISIIQRILTAQREGA